MSSRTQSIIPAFVAILVVANLFLVTVAYKQEALRKASHAVAVNWAPATEPVAETVPEMLPYENTDLNFSIEYPSRFDQVSVSSDGVSFATGSDMWGIAVRVTDTPFATTDEWLADARPKGRASGGSRALGLVGASGVVLTERLGVVDHDGDQAIFGKTVEGVLVKNHMLYVISSPAQTNIDDPVSIDPDAIRVMASLAVPDVADPDAASVDAAKATLNEFLGALFEKRYADAVGLYGGDYYGLTNWNPTVGSDDFATLWKNGCEMNGLVCIEVRNLSFARHSDENAYAFNVWFSNADKTEFSNEFDQSAFPFTVEKQIDGAFKVMTMPVYQE